MKFILEYPRWKKVKKQLKGQGMLRLPDSHKGHWHNYSLPLFPPNHYPRLHIITTSAGNQNEIKDNYYHLRLLEVHVDVSRHTHTEHIHKAIDMVQNIIKGTK